MEPSNISEVVDQVLHGISDLQALIFRFANLKDISVIAATSPNWRSAICKDAGLWKSFAASKHPELLDLYELCGESSPSDGDDDYECGWKRLLCRRMTSKFEPRGFNCGLQKKLEMVFRPDGIVAFTNCCSRCTDSYEEDPSFQIRARGINFFKVFLNGMNYSGGEIASALVCHEDWAFLNENWEKECDLIRRWCAVLGLGEDEYTIKKPDSEWRCIEVKFSRVVPLDDIPESDDEDDVLDLDDGVDNMLDGFDEYDEYDEDDIDDVDYLMESPSLD